MQRAGGEPREGLDQGGGAQLREPILQFAGGVVVTLYIVGAAHGLEEALAYLPVAAGVLGALIMTIGEIAHFWIGNAIYLSFVLAALISTSVKLVAYRRGFPSW